jgi:hypothetical protein
LQSALRFFMDALTFIFLAFSLQHIAFRVIEIYLYRKMILPLVKSYGLISTPTLSPGKIRI